MNVNERYKVQFKQLEDYVSSLNTSSWYVFSILVRGFHEHSNGLTGLTLCNKFTERVPAVIVCKKHGVDESYEQTTEYFEFRFVDNHVVEESLCCLDTIFSVGDE